jgi:hypothetical protein
VDLKPALSRLAIEERLEARFYIDDPEGAEDEASPVSSSDWVLMAPDKEWMNGAEIVDDAEEMDAPQAGRAWTDDFNNILSAVSLRGSEE